VLAKGDDRHVGYSPPQYEALFGAQPAAPL
jgi:hypothetical protein